MLFPELLIEVAQNIHVAHVENGLEALKFLRHQEPYKKSTLPSLVVLDLNMPVMNGHQFLKEVKELSHCKGIPVLILSTSDHAEDIRRSYEGHAAGYIVKPSSYQEYSEMLKLVQAYWAGAVRLPTLEAAAEVM